MRSTHGVLLLLLLTFFPCSLSFASNSPDSTVRTCSAESEGTKRGEGGECRETGLKGVKSSLQVTDGDMLRSGIITNSKLHLLYGTAWKEKETSRLVSEAVVNGFRFIDTACQPKHYNEAGVGEGWTDAAEKLGLQRSDLYIQTKFTSFDGQDPDRIPYDATNPIEDQIRESLKVSLSNLRTDYLDALVLHSPFPSMKETLRAWETMETFVDEKKVRKLGISNCYDMNKFRMLFDSARIKPSILQNRFYRESNFDTALRTFCKENGILYQSFWTLSANRRQLSRPEIRAMADAKGLTPQTLMYAFMMSLGHTPLDGTTNKEHMQEDIALERRILDGEKILSDDEQREMANILGMPGL